MHNILVMTIDLPHPFPYVPYGAERDEADPRLDDVFAASTSITWNPGRQSAQRIHVSLMGRKGMKKIDRPFGAKIMDLHRYVRLAGEHILSSQHACCKNKHVSQPLPSNLESQQGTVTEP